MNEEKRNDRTDTIFETLEDDDRLYLADRMQLKREFLSRNRQYPSSIEFNYNLDSPLNIWTIL